jgi:ATP-dependent Clp protease, protease subunit
MQTSRGFLAALAALLIFPAFPAAQTPAPPPDQTAIITFVGDINTPSMAQLIIVVNNQIRAGYKKIRIVISSGGGDPSAGFSAYSYLHGLQGIELSTFNVGNVDSAAILVYCAGQERYAVPGARFVMHGNSMTLPTNTQIDAASLQGDLEILKNLNQTISQVIEATVNKDRKNDVEAAVHGQTILTSEDAQKWGLVKEIRAGFMEPNSTLVTGNNPLPPVPETAPPPQFTSSTPAANQKP